MNWADQAWRALVAVVLVSLLAGAGVALLAPESMRRVRNGDYAPQVENLRAGRGFVGEDGRVLHRYPPLYPLLLWGLEVAGERTGLGKFPVLAVFAVLCNTATATLVWALGREVGLGPWAAAAGASLFAVHPFVLYGVLIPVSETPFMVLFTGATLFLARGLRQGEAGWLLGGGVLAGLACLMRPIALLSPVVAAGVLVWKMAGGWSARWRGVAAVAAGFLLAVLPWVGWVRAKSGEWVPVSSGGPPTLRDGLSFHHKSFRNRLELPAGVERMSEAAWNRYSELDSSGAYVRFVLRMAAEDPVAVVETYLYKAARAWYGTDAQRKGAERFNLVVSVAWLAAVGAGIWRRARADWPAAAWLLVGFTGLFWYMTTVALSIARYMTPTAALLAPLAGGIFEAGGSRQTPKAVRLEAR